ncbi:N-acetylmuramoyl-L-alanine amidase [Pseudorhodobacter sp.]|uniref:N-acetylmuramoyl-L-alanine amidase n=1 Tax=Pseudorhodobacter sp. TaxID=1934400 RepID=UPI0026491A01|nr:N-acetylmuramoyl-L-alanine amidase [Pseudorhodobacter sp.]MDN5787092.1 N-acetylmuramoyl-L-alanine amidase [Pseudorhodobacter sp.]
MPLSPNFGERRGGLVPELVVIHYTAMESCAAAAARLCDPRHEVSAHYLLDYDGTLLALVPETARAWHAGAGSWCGRDDINSRSIGIELANDGAEPFPEPQMRALETLLAGILARWNLPPEAVIGHSDMAPGRKTDPGARFDWRRLARTGLAVWPEPLGQTAPAESFAAFVQRFGYPAAPTETLLAAFRLRFRPWAKGSVDGLDAGLAQSLMLRFAIDQDGPVG